MAIRMSLPQGAGGQLGRKRIVNDMSIQVRYGEWLRLAEFEHCFVACQFSDGRADFRQESFSFEHCRPSHLVYHSRQLKTATLGRKKEIDFLVAMNAETAQDDVMSLAPGAFRSLRRAASLWTRLRSDLVFYSVP